MKPGDSTLKELRSALMDVKVVARDIGENCLQFICKGHVIAEASVVFHGYAGYKLHVVTWKPGCCGRGSDYYLDSAEAGAEKIREIIK